MRLWVWQYLDSLKEEARALGFHDEQLRDVWAECDSLCLQACGQRCWAWWIG